MDNEEDISSQTTSTQYESKNAEMKEKNYYKNENDSYFDYQPLEGRKSEGQKRYTVNYGSPSNELQRAKLQQQNFMSVHQTNLGITLNSLEEHWAYQNILLDYNILDFTSK